MSTDAPANPQYELTAWIVLATDGLVAPARERIKQEIEAHYADAVARHVTGGLPRAMAEARALDELGDIDVAAKGFRKRYLTEKEEAWLREIETGWRQTAPKRKRIFPVICVVIGLLLGFAVVFERSLRPHLDASALQPMYALGILGVIYIFSFFALVMKCHHLVLRHPPGVKLRRKLLASALIQAQLMILWGCAGPFWFCLQKFFFHPIYAGVGVVLIVALATQFDRRFRVLRKLRYAQVAGDTGVAA